MKRRTFFKTTALSGSAIAISGISGCSPESHNSVIEPDYTKFNLSEFTIDQLQQKMVSGEMTSVGICREYLDRIKLVDPILKAVIEINPDALEIAGKLDEERKNGKVRGLLHGIPVMIKDNIDTGDKMQTTAGSLAMVGNIVEQDAPIIQKLKNAGTVLLRKTNLNK